MKTLLPILILSTLSACGGEENNIPVQKTDNISWGASRITEAQKTNHEWIDSFDNAPTIPVTSTIDDALSACPKNDYCILTIDKLALSETVNLGRSKTKLIGKKNNKITFSIISGTSGTFFTLKNNVNNIVFENLNIDGESTNYGSESIHGFFIKGKSIHNIAFIKNHIHHFSSDEDAHGIAVYGTGSTENSAIENIIIDANNIHNMRTGSSESVVVNGNVKRWRISNNKISQINNIAIDAIGGEGISPVQIIDGRTLPGELDAARYGVIEGNTITDMSTETNPSYGNKHSWAGAIYIDGAHHVHILNNTVNNAEWAYDIGAENCVESRYIVLEKNTANKSYFGDLYIGGYREIGYKKDKNINCNPETTTDDIEGHGYVQNITVNNNQFNTVSPQVNSIQLENRISQSIIIHPGIKAEYPDGKVTGDQRSIRITK